ncbi:ABC transporter ATP-binding protein [Aldersonia sp. NBC_00410]|uniref:ABC transporter ATP-binding protein n=1 Tax=Aldersonia sp. NBC_00410 TaxID=2975954 RepID=UPI00225196E6|nr:ABC transporter ATP-binding protein [Aldersonia sp. NBC_00410]MCX5042006.1 ABC transporter ATP-binding protein [Aldersonia sp. NBC_00410]
MTALQCTGLSTGYFKGRPCVRNLDLNVAAGEMVCLLGPNGSGKTTTLMTIAGLLPRFGGEVRVGGHVVPGGNPRAAVRAGAVLVPDDRALFRKLSTEKNLRLAVRGRVHAKGAIDDALELFPALVPRLGVEAGQLSGGEQQMLAIGRALLQRPSVLLIDELSTGLAPTIVESILTALRDVAQKRGTAMLLVEQHVHLALESCDRAVVLVHGAVQLEEPAAVLRADPRRIEQAYLGSGGVAA